MYLVCITAFAVAVLIFDFLVFIHSVRGLREDQQKLAVWKVQFDASQAFLSRKLAEMAISIAECNSAIWVLQLWRDGILPDAECDRLLKEMGFCDNDA